LTLLSPSRVAAKHSSFLSLSFSLSAISAYTNVSSPTVTISNISYSYFRFFYLFILHITGIRFSLGTLTSDSITVIRYAFASSFCGYSLYALILDFLDQSLRILLLLKLLLFCAICFDLHAAVFCGLVWDLVESGVVDVTVCWFAEGTVLFDVVLLFGLEICFCFINWKLVSTVKLGIHKLKEKWDWHSRSFSVGFSPRRKCEFWWLVLMLLVRPLSSTSSSSERSLQQFLPLVSFWTLFLFFPRLVLFLLLYSILLVRYSFIFTIWVTSRWFMWMMVECDKRGSNLWGNLQNWILRS